MLIILTVGVGDWVADPSPPSLPHIEAGPTSRRCPSPAPGLLGGGGVPHLHVGLVGGGCVPLTHPACRAATASGPRTWSGRASGRRPHPRHVRGSGRRPHTAVTAGGGSLTAVALQRWRPGLQKQAEVAAGAVAGGPCNGQFAGLAREGSEIWWKK